MTDSTALVELEKRLAEAKCGSDDLDNAIAYALGWTRGEWRSYRDSDGDDRPYQPWVSPSGDDRDLYASACCILGRLTRSVDEALALVSRCLPDNRSVNLWIRSNEAHAELWPSHKFAHKAATPALAICLALVRALQSQSKREAGDV